MAVAEGVLEVGVVEVDVVEVVGESRVGGMGAGCDDGTARTGAEVLGVSAFDFASELSSQVRSMTVLSRCPVCWLGCSQ